MVSKTLGKIDQQEGSCAVQSSSSYPWAMTMMPDIVNMHHKWHSIS